ncbi:hypothetical protein PABG_11449 [Paracoccidioides brasiliensis Pb03]|nr:hypothetical protein PABG_11449 [Paracoccidioides brasiliensis Pb03]
MEDIHGSKDSTVNGIQAWAEKGIVGRGILLDFHRWAPTNNISTEMFKKTSIPLKYLKAVATVAGDRDKVWRHTYHSRYMQAIKQLPDDELVRLAKRTPPELIRGRHQFRDTGMIWENFSAAEGDHSSFDAYPPADWSMHEVLLAGWGCPIRELFCQRSADGRKDGRSSLRVKYAMFPSE